jgi:hypothetical protein
VECPESKVWLQSGGDQAHHSGWVLDVCEVPLQCYCHQVSVITEPNECSPLVTRYPKKGVAVITVQSLVAGCSIQVHGFNSRAIQWGYLTDKVVQTRFSPCASVVTFQIPLDPCTISMYWSIIRKMVNGPRRGSTSSGAAPLSPFWPIKSKFRFKNAYIKIPKQTV